MGYRLSSVPLQLVVLFVFMAMLGAPGGRSSAQTTRPERVSTALQDRLARGERVRVVVELRRPAGARPGAPRDGVLAALARAQDEFLQRTPHFGSAKRLDNLPVVAIDIDHTALSELTTSPDVVSVRIDQLRRPTLIESVPLIGAPTAWSLGGTGAGWTVAVIDSGVDKAHPFLVGKVVSEACYSTTNVGGNATSVCPGGINSTAVDSGIPCSPSVDGCDHGTHVAGIAAGTGETFSGVAKGASIIAIQVYSRIDDVGFCSPDASPCVGAYDSDILAGLDRVYALRSSHSIAAASLSLGTGSYPGACDAAVPAYKTAIDLLRGAGIATVVSAGNAGLTNGMTAPACVSSAISVGASDKNDQLAPYTNRSPVLKLLAPGTSIYSPAPGGGYSFFTGTSMAAAHVVGSWALVKQLNPSADVTSVLNGFVSTAVGIADTANSVTRPRIDVGAAVQATQGIASLVGRLPDFDGSQASDILWRNSTPGTYAIWLMNGGVMASSSVFGAATTWDIVGTGDLNGDGRSDLLWRSLTTGDLAIWFMNGGTVQGTAVLGVGSGWDLIGSGDINGDGKDDVIWRSVATGALAIWFMNGSTIQSSAVFGVGAGWKLIGTGDLNGDGRSDILWRSSVNGAVAIWFMNGGIVQGSAVFGVGAGWDLVASGDLNGDGRDDLLWRAVATGALGVWFMNGGSMQSSAVFGVGTEWNLVSVGDVNADGKADILWHRPTTGQAVVWFMNGATLANTAVFGVGTAWTPIGG
jgi:subtilisin family serine protease